MTTLIEKYRYSEIFKSIQGEGKFTGTPTIWIRLWSCNLQCNGFGQEDPSNPDTYVLPYKEIDITGIKSMEELPVFKYGCDSSYSWAKKFQDLAPVKSAEEICLELRNFLPERQFISDISGQDFHMAFTGGEPMLKKNQAAIVAIMKTFRMQADSPLNVTIETNGTQKPRETFINFFGNRGMFPGDLFWSCSPKLSSSGEDMSKTIKPEVLHEYDLISNKGQLKYVVDGTDRCWNEVEEVTKRYREVGVAWPIWVMPVGALKESQEEIQKEITLQAIERGYNVAVRVHCFIFGNEIGT